MWSAALFAFADPGRSNPASGSPVPPGPWSRNARIGENPNPRLNVGRAPSFSECASTRVASMSITTGPVLGVTGTSSQTRARARARAVRNATRLISASAARAAISRDTVGSDATCPNRSGWLRTTARSDRQSPPNAIATARSSTILPGSCRARPAIHGRSCSLNTVSKPTVAAVAVSSDPPADDNNDSPPTTTCSRLERRLLFTHGVPLSSVVLCLRKHQNPKQSRHFRASTPRVARSLAKLRG